MSEINFNNIQKNSDDNEEDYDNYVEDIVEEIDEDMNGDGDDEQRDIDYNDDDVNDINDNELIVKTDSIIDVEPLGLVGKGLPDYENPEEYGNIVILFDVVFPETLSVETKQELRKLLPESESIDETGDNVITLEEVDYDSETESETESEEEEPRGGGAPPPGCATQ